jgi:hypothetical protein
MMELAFRGSPVQRISQAPARPYRAVDCGFLINAASKKEHSDAEITNFFDAFVVNLIQQAAALTGEDHLWTSMHSSANRVLPTTC